MSPRLLFSVLLSLLFAARVAAQADTPAVPAPAAQTSAAPAPAPAPAAAKPAAETPIQPVAQVEGAEPHKAAVSRDKDTLTVDFPDEDIKTILRNVADLFELNLVVPDTLAGKTSIKLRDVTWRQIFQVVLGPVGYTYLEDGNIIKIISNESLQQEPSSTEVFVLNYAKAADIKPTLDALVEAASGGKIVIDTRSNALVITERPSRMARIRAIIEKLDNATDQVMIESKFVEVTDYDVRDIGIKWSSLQNYQVGVGNITKTYSRTNGQESSDGYSNSRTSTLGTTGSNGTTVATTTSTGTSSSTTPTTSTTVTSTNGNVTTVSTTGTTTTLGSTSATGGNSTTSTSTGNSTSTTDAGTLLQSLTNTVSSSSVASAVFSASDFNLILSALKTQTNTKIVSNPTVVTLNNTEASINVGEEYPVPNYTYNQERGSFEVAGFVYKNIGINLKVTPQVNSRGFIKLTLEPEVSQQNGSTSFGGSSGATIPIIATRKAKTQVSLKNGFTMGIGGLVKTSASHGGTSVPVLSSIPGIGKLFSSKSVNDSTTNLLIFITARTVSADGAPVEEVFDPRAIKAVDMKRIDLPGYRSADPFATETPAATDKKATKKADSKESSSD